VAKIHHTLLPVTSLQMEKLPTSYRYIVSDTANKSATSWQQVVVMEFGKRHDTHNGFCPRQLGTDLLRTCRLCCGLVVDLLRGNCCNRFWPLRYILQPKYLKKWIGSALLGTRRYNFQPTTSTLSGTMHIATDRQTDRLSIVPIADRTAQYDRLKS